MSEPEKFQYKFGENLKMFVAITGGSSVGETVSLPFNSIKVILQLQGEHCKCVGDELAVRPSYYTGTWDAIRKIVQNHGVKYWNLLTNGLDSIYGRQVLYNGVRVFTYQPIRWLYYQQLLAFNYPCTVDDYCVRLPTNLTTCAIAVFCCQPTTVIKGRAQSPEPVTRKKFRQLAKTIYREEGLFGFWRALLPVYLRLSMYTGLSTYFFEQLRRDLISKKGVISWNEFWNVLGTIGLMDVIYVVSANPLDLMRIRIINSTPRYHGLLDCMHWTVKNEGILAFYKGFGASLWCTFIHDLIYFFLFVEIKSQLDKVY